MGTTADDCEQVLPPIGPYTRDMTARISKIDQEEIATGLALPTAMTFGPDDMLYVSNYGFGFPAGAGEIVKITVP